MTIFFGLWYVLFKYWTLYRCLSVFSSRFLFQDIWQWWKRYNHHHHLSWFGGNTVSFPPNARPLSPLIEAAVQCPPDRWRRRQHMARKQQRPSSLLLCLCLLPPAWSLHLRAVSLVSIILIRSLTADHHTVLEPRVIKRRDWRKGKRIRYASCLRWSFRCY